MQTPKTKISLAPQLKKTLEGLNCLLIGGCVRDHLLGEDPKDIDIEVYGKTQNQLEEHLLKSGAKVNAVGKAFGVLKATFEGETYDFSLPRKEVKTGTGHREFSVEPCPDISPRDASLRRDLTINALGWNPNTHEICDFHNGIKDLDEGTLRHVSRAFSEDVLRPLRVFQFAARFGFEVHPETAELCRELYKEAESLPKERIGEEFSKFLFKGEHIKHGFDTLKEIGWLKLFPEIEAIDQVQQDHLWHPEGDVLSHTSHCISAMKNLKEWKDLPEKDRTTLLYGILCHDLGKATTTQRVYKPEHGREVITSPGHDKAGVEPTLSLLNRLGLPKRYHDPVTQLVAHHMDHLLVRTPAQVLRLSTELPNTSIHHLGIICEADHSGRPPLPKKKPDAMKSIEAIAKEKDCFHSPVKAFLTGKDILDQYPALEGKGIGVLLKGAYEGQIQLKVTSKEEAIHFIKKNVQQLLLNSKTGPKRLLTGKDLIETGTPPGPIFNKILQETYKDQLKGKITTREEALAKLQNQIEPTI